jgi:hypothetical protein
MRRLPTVAHSAKVGCLLSIPSFGWQAKFTQERGGFDCLFFAVRRPRPTFVDTLDKLNVSRATIRHPSVGCVYRSSMRADEWPEIDITV